MIGPYIIKRSKCSAFTCKGERKAFSRGTQNYFTLMLKFHNECILMNIKCKCQNHRFISVSLPIPAHALTTFSLRLVSLSVAKTFMTFCSERKNYL